MLEFLISKITGLGHVTFLKRDPNTGLPFFTEDLFSHNTNRQLLLILYRISDDLLYLKKQNKKFISPFGLLYFLVISFAI